MKIRNKKGQMDMLQSIGFGVLTLCILVGIGIMVLYQLGGTQANCVTGACGAAGTWDTTTSACKNATAACGDPVASSAYTSIIYGATQIGSTGLLSWLPAVIALLIGVFFLAYFMGRKKEY